MSIETIQLMSRVSNYRQPISERFSSSPQARAAVVRVQALNGDRDTWIGIWALEMGAVKVGKTANLTPRRSDAKLIFPNTPFRWDHHAHRPQSLRTGLRIKISTPVMNIQVPPGPSFSLHFQGHWAIHWLFTMHRAFKEKDTNFWSQSSLHLRNSLFHLYFVQIIGNLPVLAKATSSMKPSSLFVWQLY